MLDSPEATLRERITCIKSFVRTVETGSFSAVARELNTTQPTISKQIAALEAYLDVQLLIRSTRQVSLTDEGTRFYQHAQLVLAALAEAKSSVGSRQIPSGVLRVNCSVAFGQRQIVPRLNRFLDRYALHRRGHFQPAKVKCFIDFLVAEFIGETSSSTC
jgi:DNA-binding transcriptional LysR family regulator